MAKKIIYCIVALMLLATSSAGADDGSRIVVDAMGRRVEVPPAHQVRRVIALGSSMAFVTFMGAQDRVVGVEDLEKDELSKPYIMLNKKLVADLPVVCKGGAVRIPNFERIIELKPDVVFLVSVDPAEPDNFQRKLRVPVVVVSQGQPVFDEEIFFSSLVLTGDVLGCTTRAQELVQGIKSLPKRLSYRPDPTDQVMAYVGGLSYRGNQDIKSTSGNFFPMLLAGVGNVADSTGRTGHHFVNKEFLLQANPPLLFIDSNGLPLIREDARLHPEYYQRLQAIEKKNAWVLLPHTSYWNNPELLYINAFFMAKIAYPKQYPDLDPVAMADEIFTLFNGAPQYDDFVRLVGPIGPLSLE
ncbi:iron ABC transporter substrate-binding protein [Desulfovibrionales bacterium]